MNYTAYLDIVVNISDIINGGVPLSGSSAVLCNVETSYPRLFSPPITTTINKPANAPTNLGIAALGLLEAVKYKAGLNFESILQTQNTRKWVVEIISVLVTSILDYKKENNLFKHMCILFDTFDFIVH